jgi:hypothetical protein
VHSAGKPFHEPNQTDSLVQGLQGILIHLLRYRHPSVSADLSRLPFPSQGVGFDFRHVDDPLLAGNGLKGRILVEHQNQIPGSHQGEFGKGSLDGGKNLLQGNHTFPDALERDTRFEQFLGGLAGDQVLEGVSSVAPMSPERRYHQTGLLPVSQLARRDADDVADLPLPEKKSLRSHLLLSPQFFKLFQGVFHLTPARFWQETYKSMDILSIIFLSEEAFVRHRAEEMEKTFKNQDIHRNQEISPV